MAGAVDGMARTKGVPRSSNSTRRRQDEIGFVLDVSTVRGSNCQISWVLPGDTTRSFRFDVNKLERITHKRRALGACSHTRQLGVPAVKSCESPNKDTILKCLNRDAA